MHQYVRSCTFIADFFLVLAAHSYAWRWSGRSGNHAHILETLSSVWLKRRQRINRIPLKSYLLSSTVRCLRVFTDDDGTDSRSQCLPMLQAKSISQNDEIQLPGQNCFEGSMRGSKRQRRRRQPMSKHIARMYTYVCIKYAAQRVRLKRLRQHTQTGGSAPV